MFTKFVYLYIFLENQNIPLEPPIIININYSFLVQEEVESSR